MLNRLSKHMYSEGPARSVVEMMRDGTKMETKKRLLKFRHEKEEQKKYTYKPNLTNNKFSQRAKSKIKIMTETDSYVERLQREQQKREQKRIEYMERKRIAEEAQCTFQPKIKACPEYVSRIAESIKKGGGLKRETIQDDGRFKF